VDVAQFRGQREEAHERQPLRRLLGPPLADRADVQTMSLNYGGQFFYLENGKWEFKVGPTSRTSIRQMHDMIHVDKSVDRPRTASPAARCCPRSSAASAR
jgi:hypothetical protein